MDSPVQPNITTSPTVAGAINRLGPQQQVPAIAFAREIIRTHTKDYSPREASTVLRLLNEALQPHSPPIAQTSKTQSPGQTAAPWIWLQQVSALYNPAVVKELHGRLVLIGLSLLDAEVLEILLHKEFLHNITGEVNRIETLFSNHGHDLFNNIIRLSKPGVSDYVKNQGDEAVLDKTGDQLDRFAFADFLVKLLNNTDLSRGSYALHLYAPWGAGKTSVMNFMKVLLKNKTDRQNNWVVVDFNAWQNQTIPYPWWTIMKHIYKEVKRVLPWSVRFREWWWRFRISRLHYVAAALIIIWLIVLFVIPQTATPMTATIENINKTILAIVSISAFFFGLAKDRSQKGAQNYIDTEDDPMVTFKDRFTKLIGAIAPARVAIFIDDLDRCKSSYVVTLLENIQTLFKESNVIFIIAADIKWIHACYEVEYDKIKPYVGAEGKPIGPLFVEKMFQLSVALPGVPPDIKQKLWYSLLTNPVKSAEQIDVAVPQIATVQEREELIKKANNESFQQNHAIRLEVMKSLAESKALEQTEHFLRPYSIFLDLNPRSMKRLLNSFTVNKASSLISHIDIPIHQLVLWTILSTRWPLLAEYVLKHPETINQPGVEMNGLPDHVKPLFSNKEAKHVLKGGGIGEALTAETVDKCRALFM